MILLIYYINKNINNLISNPSILVPDKSAVFKFINYNLTKYSTINNVDKKVFLKGII